MTGRFVWGPKNLIVVLSSSSFDFSTCHYHELQFCMYTSAINHNFFPTICGNNIFEDLLESQCCWASSFLAGSGSWYFFSPAPAAPTPIKSRLSTIKNFFLQHTMFFTRYIYFLISISFFKHLNQCWNERRDYHSEFLLLSKVEPELHTGSGKKYRLRLHNTVLDKDSV